MTDITLLAIQAVNATAQLRAASSSASASANTTSTKSADPTAGTVLAFGAKQPAVADEVRRLLAGGGVVSAADQKAALAPGPDDQRFFTLFKAIDSLRSLAQAAARDPAKNETSEIPASLKTRAETVFQSQLAALKTLVGTLPFRDVTAVAGSIGETEKANRFFASGGFDYVGAPVAADGVDAPVAAFDGPLTFQAQVSSAAGNITVNFDLAEIAGPRTLNSVAAYINSKLADAGALTQVSVVGLGAANSNNVVTSGQYGFRVEGLSFEQISFSAPATGPAAILVNPSAGGDSARVTRVEGLGGANDAQTATIATLSAQNGRLTPRASALGPDGSIYVLSQATGSVAGQTIKGDQDVVLQRIDSTGKILFTRTLGAAAQGQGFSVSAGANGNVVIAGALRGKIDDTAPALTGAGLDAYVASFDSSGREIFTRQQPLVGDNAYTAVKIAGDGSIVLGGDASASQVDGQAVDGRDAFVEKLDANGQRQFIRQFSNPGSDRVDAVTIDANGTILAGLNANGRAVVQEVTGANATSSERRVDLGALDGGHIAGLALDTNGDVVLAGDVGAQGLKGVLSGDRGGESDGFVARLSRAGSDFSVQYAKALSAAGGGGDRVGGVALDNGTVYVSGTTDAAFGGASLSGARNSFLVQADATNGAVGRVDNVAGNVGDNGGSLVIDPRGQTALNRLGLPQGSAQFTDSTRVIDQTSARPGDSFSFSVNGGPVRKITLRADDTLSSLAFRVNQALRFDGRVELRSATLTSTAALASGDAPQSDRIAGETLSGTQLSFEPAAGKQLTLTAGSSGQDLLSALGLKPGIVFKAPPKSAGTSASAPAPRFLQLSIDGALSITDRKSAAAAVNTLTAAESAIRNAFRAVNAPPPAAASTNTSASKAPPAFLSAQLANLQAGLARLQASSTASTTGTTDTSAGAIALSLFA